MKNNIHTHTNHPVINDMYLSKEHTYKHSEKHLVIETNANTTKSQKFMDLLTDLSALNDSAQKNLGSFDYIDIRLN